MTRREYVLDFRRQQCVVCGEPSTSWRIERGRLIPVCSDHVRGKAK